MISPHWDGWIIISTQEKAILSVKFCINITKNVKNTFNKSFYRETQSVGGREPRKCREPRKVTTPAQKLYTINGRLGEGCSPTSLDTKTPAESNFTTWYPRICKIYSLLKIIRETINFFKEIANITQRHSEGPFWLYWNTYVDFPMVYTPFLLQYRYNRHHFFYLLMFKCMKNTSYLRLV